jgi:hypothetical protein
MNKQLKDQDKRKKLSDAITDPWSGWTCDFYGITLIDRQAAVKAMKVFSNRAHNSASNVVIIRGILEIESESSYIAGIICLNKDANSHGLWLADAINNIQGSKDNKIMAMSDKGPYEFGFDDSPIIIHDYELIGIK